MAQPPPVADAVIVGAGIVGLTIAYELASAGMTRVVVFDAGTPGQQSTGRATGGIRRQFGSELEIRLTDATLDLYRPMFADPEFGGRFARDGYLFLAGPEQHDRLSTMWQLQGGAGVPTMWLDPETLRETYPFIDLSGISGGTFCADDGFVDPWSIVQWLLQKCRSLGVVILARQAVDRIDVTNGHVQGVATGASRVATGVVVNAAGAWAGVVGGLAGVSIPVQPSPRVQVVTGPQRAIPDTTPLIVDLTSGGYIRATAGRVLAGVAPRTIPVGFELEATPDDLEVIAACVALRFPELADVSVSSVITGLYEITPDGLPIASFGEDLAGFCTVAGFNGHGIMHSAPLACAMADTIVRGHSDRFDLAPFSVRRFAAGTAVHNRASGLI